MTSFAVEARNLSKRYRRGAIGAKTLREELQLLLERRRSGEHRVSNAEFYALKDVSFSVPAGRACAVIGRNGSGKTTLLKLLTSITAPSSGEATLRGRIGSLLEVGAGFHPELDGIENIYLNGAILGMSKAEITRKLDQIIAFADIGPVLTTPVKRYSSGMYVRLAFSVAAHLEPDILIIDEVLAVGDADFQRKCLGKMKNVAGEGRTVLFVSHNLAAVRQLCDIAIYLNKGEVAAIGPTSSVVESYLSGLSFYDENTSRIAGEGYSAEILLIDVKRNFASHQLQFNESYQLVLRVTTATPIQRATAAVLIYNEDGSLISMLSSIQEGLDPFDLVDEGEIVFSIPELSLMPGRYSVGFAIYTWGEDTPRISADLVCAFHVVPAIVNNASDSYSSEYGVCRLSRSAEFRTPNNRCR